MADRGKKQNRDNECKVLVKGIFVLFLHVMLVLSVFAIGAICFMLIEDPEFSEEDKSSIIIIKEEVFLDSLQRKYHLNLSEIGSSVFSDFKNYFDQLASNATKKEQIEAVEDRWATFAKWFYFTNIVGTTIGASMCFNPIQTGLTENRKIRGYR